MKNKICNQCQFENDCHAFSCPLFVEQSLEDVLKPEQCEHPVDGDWTCENCEPTPKDSYEEEFDKKFKTNDDEISLIVRATPREMKDFIRTLLDTEREKVKREMGNVYSGQKEDWKKEIETDLIASLKERVGKMKIQSGTEETDGYNQAITDILSEIDK